MLVSIWSSFSPSDTYSLKCSGFVLVAAVEVCGGVARGQVLQNGPNWPQMWGICMISPQLYKLEGRWRERREWAEQRHSVRSAEIKHYYQIWCFGVETYGWQPRTCHSPLSRRVLPRLTVSFLGLCLAIQLRNSYWNLALSMPWIRINIWSGLVSPILDLKIILTRGHVSLCLLLCNSFDHKLHQPVFRHFPHVWIVDHVCWAILVVPNKDSLLRHWVQIYLVLFIGITQWAVPFCWVWCWGFMPNPISSQNKTLLTHVNLRISNWPFYLSIKQ